MHAAARTGRLQRTFFIALLIVGILPGMVALWATYHPVPPPSNKRSEKDFRNCTFHRDSPGDRRDDEIDRTAHLASTPAATHKRDSHRKHQQPTMAGSCAAKPPDGSRSISPGWLDTWARESRHYARVTVTDAQGLVIASTDPTLTARQDDQTWWREAMQAKPGMAYVSTVVPDPRNSEAVFHIAVPRRRSKRDHHRHRRRRSPSQPPHA